MNLPAKMRAAPKTGLGIIDKMATKLGKKARIIKIIPAPTLIHLLRTFVAPAKPILLDEVSTAIPPNYPARGVKKPSAKRPFRIGTKFGSFNSGSDIF